MTLTTQLSIQSNGLNEDQVEFLATYVAKQLNNGFPSAPYADDFDKICLILPPAIERLRRILRAVKCFKTDIFEYNNSLQYCILLYLLANVSSKIGVDSALSDRLFCLNKSLNSFDLFYKIEMPDVFFVSHGVGSVLGNAKYGNGLVIFQNVTVGRVGRMSPVIGNNVVLYPGSVVTGSSIIGNNSIVAAGTILHNVTVPNNVVAKNIFGEIIFKENKNNYIDLYLDLKS